MTLSEIQATISAAIERDAESVIAAAIAFRPGIRAVVRDVRGAPGTVAGVAAYALRIALRGADNTETLANMAAFAATIAAQQ